MSKLTKLFSTLLVLVALTPLAQAHSSRVSDQPITIKSATIETKSSRVVGEVEVCNKEKERVAFLLEVKNLSINSLYKRRMSVPAADCITTKLHFTRDFAEMSNVGDEIEMKAKRVRGLFSRDRFVLSEQLTTNVVKGARDLVGCADQEGEDGIFAACVNDFVYHLPSGLRLKVTENNWDYAELRLTHIEWGGVKRMRIYKGRTKKIRSNYDELERLKITNVHGERTNDLFLKIESA